MEKELKFCTVVLLRADLTGHGQFSQSANFCQKGWDGHVLLSQPTKGRPCRTSFFFPQCSTTFETYNCSLIFLYQCDINSYLSLELCMYLGKDNNEQRKWHLQQNWCLLFSFSASFYRYICLVPDWLFSDLFLYA